MGFFTKFFGRTASEGAAFALGTAVGPALSPAVRELVNVAWQTYPSRPLDAGTLSSIVAEDVKLLQWGRDQAAMNGVNTERFDAAVEAVRSAPDMAVLLALWRRGLISETDFEHGLHKAKLEERWDASLKDLFVGRLDPAIVATAIQRGIMADPGILPVGPPSAVGKVPAFPVSPLDPVKEAKAQGIDLERLFVETAIVGLPMSLQEAASAFFRGIITLDDFNRAVSEGNTRNEWREFILEQARSILSPNQYAELQLRGFLTETQRRAKTDQYGMHHGDSDLLYDLLGRSIPVHQIETGEARGGVYDGDFSHVPEAYLSSLRRGNLRPEFYNLAYANRYSYPSAFFFRLLLTTGAITAAEAEQAFLDIGWSPHWATLVSQTLAKQAPVKGDPHIGKAETQLWSALHRSFVARETNVTQAKSVMGQLAIPTVDRDTIITLWQAERDLIRRQLTPAQIKKAYAKAARNAATGAAWTRDEAIAALVSEGYGIQTANDYLDIP